MTVIKSSRLVFTVPPSDKEYNAQVIKNNGDYRVEFQYGRRNGTLQSGVKIENATLAEAEKVYTKLLNEKISKGYVPDGESKGFVATATPKESVGLVPQLLNTISEQELEALIDDDNWCFQEKKDGERRMIVDECGANKKGQKVALPSSLSINTNKWGRIDLDGELIGDTLHAFDVTFLNDKDLKKTAYKERLALLESMTLGNDNPGIVVVKTAYTTKDKRALLAKLKKDNAEGIVAKDLRAKYSSSRPASGGPALKFKFYKTATVKVSEITKGKRSVQMNVIDGKGNVEVGAVTIPPNKDIPKVGDLIEVRYLYAYKGGSLFQPTYLGVRNDCDLEDASIKQLEYKREEE